MDCNYNTELNHNTHVVKMTTVEHNCFIFFSNIDFDFKITVTWRVLQIDEGHNTPKVHHTDQGP